MQFLKISCIRCAHYQDCPQKTRMYINYCGADFKRVEEKVIDATIDCRTRRGLLFATNFLAAIPVTPVLQTELATVSS